jgi:hypothetical protein
MEKIGQNLVTAPQEAKHSYHTIHQFYYLYIQKKLMSTHTKKLHTNVQNSINHNSQSGNHPNVPQLING